MRLTPEVVELIMVFVVSTSKRGAALAATRLTALDFYSPAAAVAFTTSLALDCTGHTERAALVDRAVAAAGYRPLWGWHRSVLDLAKLSPVASDERGWYAAQVKANADRRRAERLLTDAQRELRRGALAEDVLRTIVEAVAA